MSDDLLLNSDLDDNQQDQQQEAEKAPEQPEVKAEPPAKEPDKQPDMVPASVLASTRAELKAQADYWRGIAEQQSKPKQEEKPGYDFIADPDALPRFVEERLTATERKIMLNVSHSMNVRQHGKDIVEQATTAAQGNQAVVAAAMSSPDPYGYLVDWHNSQRVLSEVGNDPAAYERKLREKIMAEIKAQQAVNEAKGRTAPASLAGDANLGVREHGPEEMDLSAIIGRGG